MFGCIWFYTIMLDYELIYYYKSFIQFIRIIYIMIYIETVNRSAELHEEPTTNFSPSTLSSKETILSGVLTKSGECLDFILYNDARLYFVVLVFISHTGLFYYIP